MSKITFGPSTDYNNVERVTRLIRGDVVARNGDCCGTKAVNDALCSTASDLSAAVDAKSLSQQDRYNDFVKRAYLTIYPFAGNDYNP